MLPWVICGALGIGILALECKVYLMQKSMDEICGGLEEILSSDTNTLLDISSGDQHVRRLAQQLNHQLRSLRQQRQQYRQGDAELKTAVTNITHDLRTPLTAISGYLELLAREEKSEAVCRYLDYIANRTGAMKKLTEELFRYTVILSAEELEREECDIRGVLEESLLAFYGALSESGIQPEIILPETPVKRMANGGALSRVFGNILSNALKYSDGDLRVEMKSTGEIEFSNKAGGLDEVQVGRLFDRFYTVESAQHSTGLGFSIAKTLMEQMQGTIQAAYRDGRLYITLEL